MAMVKVCDFCKGFVDETEHGVPVTSKVKVEKNGVIAKLTITIDGEPDLHRKCEVELHRLAARTALDGLIVKRPVKKESTKLNRRKTGKEENSGGNSSKDK